MSANVMKVAKSLRKQFPRMKWKDLVKKAGKKVRTRNRQTGKSDKRADEQRSARKPGKRRSRSGNVYIERRKNRSDVPGKVTGIKEQVKEKLGSALLRYELATTIPATKKASSDIKRWRKVMRSL